MFSSKPKQIVSHNGYLVVLLEDGGMWKFDVERNEVQQLAHEYYEEVPTNEV